MCEQNHMHRATVNPAGIFKSPMDVVEASGIQLVEKVAILKAWEADERALLRAEDEGMNGGEHAHLHKVLAALDHLKNLGSSEKLAYFRSARRELVCEGAGTGV
jgi:hypothetical protein